MTDCLNIENDDTDSVLPYKYRPGTDLISKMTLTDNQVINMLMKTLVPEAAEDHYVSTPTEFINKNKCDDLYAPRNPLSTFPLVFIEVQNHVDEKFLVRAVHYSYLFCSQAVSISALDYAKNDKTVKLLDSITRANLEKLSGEEVEKLEAISNICNSSQTQLQKIKRYLEVGDKTSKEKALNYVGNTLEFLR